MRTAERLKELRESRDVQACFGVYLGDRVLRDGPVHVLPVTEFLRELDRGNVLPKAAGRHTTRPKRGAKALI